MLVSNELKNGKTLAIIALVIGALLGWLPVFGGIFKIVAWILMVFAVKSVAVASQSPTLFKSYLYTCLCAIACAFFGFFILWMPILFIMLILASTIGFVYFGYRYYKEMRNISGIALFFYAFICMAISFALSLLWLGFIGWIFNLAGFILELIAWINLSQIKIDGEPSTNATEKSIEFADSAKKT